MKKSIIFSTILFSIIFASASANASTGNRFKKGEKAITAVNLSDSHMYYENAYAKAKKVKPTIVKETRPEEIRERYLRQIFGKYAIIYSATA